MGFYAKSFVYDSQPSELYNLQIANIGEGSNSGRGSGTIDIIEQFIYRRAVPYFYGIHYTDKLEFPVTIFSEDEITALDASYIQNWLFAQQSYKVLSVIQSDMDEIYFNCIFTQPQILKYGNIIYGFSGNCVCDSQFAWTYPKTISYSSPSGSYIFYNNSHYAGYLYPSMTVTMSGSGGFSIINSTDNNRECSFTSLAANEVITLNNDLGIVQSSTGLARLSNFNKNFFRFVPGINQYSISGSVSSFSMTYQFARRLGG